MSHHPTMRVEVVCFDAVYTLLDTTAPRSEILARLLKEEAGIECSPDEAWAQQLLIRRQYPRSGQDLMAYWLRANEHLLYSLGLKVGVPRAAHRIHDRWISDGNLYTVRKDVRTLIAWASERVKIAIASNQRHRALLGLLKQHGIAEHFEGRVFTSGRLKASKPHRRFFLALRSRLGLRQLGQLALVGNSLENDAPAADLGILTVLFDRSGSLSRAGAPSLPAGVTPASTVEEIKCWITEAAQLTDDCVLRNGTHGG